MVRVCVFKARYKGKILIFLRCNLVIFPLLVISTKTKGQNIYNTHNVI